MPRKSTQPKQVDRADNPPPQPFANTKDATWGGYINVNLSPEDDALFEEMWRGEWSNIQEWLLTQQMFGRSYSSRYVAEDQCFLVSLTGRAMREYDTRCCLTARSPIWQEAVALLWYKDVQLLSSDWGSYKPKSASRSRG